MLDACSPEASLFFVYVKRLDGYPFQSAEFRHPSPRAWSADSKITFVTSKRDPLKMVTAGITYARQSSFLVTETSAWEEGRYKFLYNITNRNTWYFPCFTCLYLYSNDLLYNRNRRISHSRDGWCYEKKWHSRCRVQTLRPPELFSTPVFLKATGRLVSVLREQSKNNHVSCYAFTALSFLLPRTLFLISVTFSVPQRDPNLKRIFVIVYPMECGL